MVLALVVGDLHVEGVERLTLDLHRGAPERPSEVGDPGEVQGEVFVVLLASVAGPERGQGQGEGGVFGRAVP